MAKSKNAKKKAKQRSLQEGGSQDLNAQSSPSSPAFEVLSSPTLMAARDGPIKTGSSSSSSQPHKSTLNTTHPNGSNSGASSALASASLDDMALELFVAKEAQSEVEILRSQVARLQKEIEFKDAIIAKLQAESGSRLEKPTLMDTIAHAGSSGSSSSTRHQHRDMALQCSICEQVQSSIASLPEPERGVAMKKIQADENSLKRVQSGGDLWRGLFKPLGFEGLGNTILDDDDGVSDVEDSDDSQEHTDGASEPDQYDSHDSFINDDDIDLEDWSDNNSSNDGDAGGRRNRRRQPRAIQNRTARGGQRLNSRLIRREQAVVNISDDSSNSDSDEQEGSLVDSAEEDVRNTNGLDSEEEDSDEIEEVLQRNRLKGRRHQTRRAIVVLDDDDSAEDNSNNNNSNSSSSKGSSSNSSNSKGAGKQVAVASTSSNVRGTKRASNGSNNQNNTTKGGKKDTNKDTSDSDSDDDFMTTFSHRNKKHRSANLEALFE
ncbi:hypothetical protein BGX26_012517 [Mortierella sp. AD094]|nr:hypothetical protein BGX26_012517 [Mortierella sp. AD094]